MQLNVILLALIISCQQMQSTAALKCYVCNPTSSTDYLSDGNETTIDCGTDIGCYTNMAKNGLVTCGCAANYNCTPSTCQICNQADLCNTLRSSRADDFTCIRCRSDVKEDCWDNADKMTGSACSKAGGQDKGCFQGVWHDVAIRGCLIDADERLQYTCNNEKDNSCSVCKAKDCNNKKSSAPAALKGISISVLLLHLICIWKTY